jgi:hypothetical protein
VVVAAALIITVDLAEMVVVALAGCRTAFSLLQELQTQAVAVAAVHRKTRLFPGRRAVPVSSLFATRTVLL